MNNWPNLGYLANTPAQNSKANDSKYELTAPLDSTKFMAGQTLNVMITQTGVQIPKTSVKDGHVYVVENKKLSGSQLQERHLMEVFIVKSGISKGQRVIVDPDKGLKDGKTVETNDWAKKISISHMFKVQIAIMCSTISI